MVVRGRSAAPEFSNHNAEWEEEEPSNLTLPQISGILPPLMKVRTYIWWYNSRAKRGDWYQVQRVSQGVDEYGFFTGKFAVDESGIKEALHAKHLDVYVGTGDPRQEGSRAAKVFCARYRRKLNDKIRKIGVSGNTVANVVVEGVPTARDPRQEGSRAAKVFCARYRRKLNDKIRKIGVSGNTVANVVVEGVPTAREGDTIWLLNRSTERYEGVVVLSIDLQGGAMDVYQPQCNMKGTAGEIHKGVSVLSPDVRTSKNPGEPTTAGYMYTRMEPRHETTEVRLGWKEEKIAKHLNEFWVHGLLTVVEDVVCLIKLELVEYMKGKDTGIVLVICTVLAWVKNPLCQVRLAGDLNRGKTLVDFLRSAWIGPTPDERAAVSGEYNAQQCNWKNRMDGLKITFPENKCMKWEEDATPLILFSHEIRRVFEGTIMEKIKSDANYALNVVW
eukprot:CAMPEP_0185792182 /NCGR_PEP_ID=MMETSP1174-20130828/158789_1 /TAXON_ID=35687 /ORGANISM="Dictyocha speculum, Strain CCMP1381" /LENGTH=444 /DNA_ID=CAMNT_0028487213 /DNA_START=168 /DNA_END=1500 /DNA_ORIENTATION=-